MTAFGIREGISVSAVPQTSHDPDVLRLAYQLSMARLIEADSKLWQAPGLSLTAQAFLLTIALGSNNYEPRERVLAALLGILVALASVQLVERHRFHARCDFEYLRSLEKGGVMPPLVERESLSNAPDARGLARLRSAWLWEATMGLFGLVNLVVGVGASMGVL